MIHTAIILSNLIFFAWVISRANANKNRTYINKDGDMCTFMYLNDMIRFSVAYNDIKIHSIEFESFLGGGGGGIERVSTP